MQRVQLDSAESAGKLYLLAQRLMTRSRLLPLAQDGATLYGDLREVEYVHLYQQVHAALVERARLRAAEHEQRERGACPTVRPRRWWGKPHPTNLGSAVCAGDWADRALMSS